MTKFREDLKNIYQQIRKIAHDANGTIDKGEIIKRIFKEGIYLNEKKYTDSDRHTAKGKFIWRIVNTIEEKYFSPSLQTVDQQKLDQGNNTQIEDEDSETARDHTTIPLDLNHTTVNPRNNNSNNNSNFMPLQCSLNDSFSISNQILFKKFSSYTEKFNSDSRDTQKAQDKTTSSLSQLQELIKLTYNFLWESIQKYPKIPLGLFISAASYSVDFVVKKIFPTVIPDNSPAADIQTALPAYDPAHLLNRFSQYTDIEIYKLLQYKLRDQKGNLKDANTFVTEPFSTKSNTPERSLKRFNRMMKSLKNLPDTGDYTLLVPYLMQTPHGRILDFILSKFGIDSNHWVGYTIQVQPNLVFISNLDSKGVHNIHKPFKTVLHNYFKDIPIVHYKKYEPHIQIGGSNDCGGHVTENLIATATRAVNRDDLNSNNRIDIDNNDQGYGPRSSSDNMRIEHYKILVGRNCYAIQGWDVSKTISFSGLLIKQVAEHSHTIQYIYETAIAPFISENHNVSVSYVLSYLENDNIKLSMHLGGGLLSSLSFPGPASPVTRFVVPISDTISYQASTRISDYFLPIDNNSTTKHILYRCAMQTLIDGSIGTMKGVLQVYLIPGLNFIFPANNGFSSAVSSGTQCYTQYAHNEPESTNFWLLPVIDFVVLSISLYSTISYYNTYHGKIDMIPKISLMLSGLDLANRFIPYVYRFITYVYNWVYGENQSSMIEHVVTNVYNSSDGENQNSTIAHVVTRILYDFGRFLYKEDYSFRIFASRISLDGQEDSQDQFFVQIIKNDKHSPVIFSNCYKKDSTGKKIIQAAICAMPDNFWKHYFVISSPKFIHQALQTPIETQDFKEEYLSKFFKDEKGTHIIFNNKFSKTNKSTTEEYVWRYTKDSSWCKFIRGVQVVTKSFNSLAKTNIEILHDETTGKINNSIIYKEGNIFYIKHIYTDGFSISKPLSYVFESLTYVEKGRDNSSQSNLSIEYEYIDPIFTFKPFSSVIENHPTDIKNIESASNLRVEAMNFRAKAENRIDPIITRILGTSTFQRFLHKGGYIFRIFASQVSLDRQKRQYKFFIQITKDNQHPKIILSDCYKEDSVSKKIIQAAICIMPDGGWKDYLVISSSKLINKTLTIFRNIQDVKKGDLDHFFKDEKGTRIILNDEFSKTDKKTTEEYVWHYTKNSWWYNLITGFQIVTKLFNSLAKTNIEILHDEATGKISNSIIYKEGNIFYIKHIYTDGFSISKPLSYVFESLTYVEKGRDNSSQSNLSIEYEYIDPIFTFKPFSSVIENHPTDIKNIESASNLTVEAMSFQAEAENRIDPIITRILGTSTFQRFLHKGGYIFRIFASQVSLDRQKRQYKFFIQITKDNQHPKIILSDCYKEDSVSKKIIQAAICIMPDGGWKDYLVISSSKLINKTLTISRNIQNVKKGDLDHFFKDEKGTRIILNDEFSKTDKKTTEEYVWHYTKNSWWYNLITGFQIVTKLFNSLAKTNIEILHDEATGKISNSIMYKQENIFYIQHIYTGDFFISKPLDSAVYSTYTSMLQISPKSFKDEPINSMIKELQEKMIYESDYFFVGNSLFKIFASQIYLNKQEDPQYHFFVQAINNGSLKVRISGCYRKYSIDANIIKDSICIMPNKTWDDYLEISFPDFVNNTLQSPTNIYELQHSHNSFENDKTHFVILQDQLTEEHKKLIRNVHDLGDEISWYNCEGRVRCSLNGNSSNFISGKDNTDIAYDMITGKIKNSYVITFSRLNREMTVAIKHIYVDGLSIIKFKGDMSAKTDYNHFDLKSFFNAALDSDAHLTSDQNEAMVALSISSICNSNFKEFMNIYSHGTQNISDYKVQAQEILGKIEECKSYLEQI